VGKQDSAAHWDAAYAAGETTQSWFQRQPSMSLAMLERARVTAADSVLDVGGGPSPLAGALLDRGFPDITVLDISASAIQLAWRRLGTRAAQVTWLVADLRSWQPERQYQVWHDRAVLHFMTTAADQQAYWRALDSATGPGAVAVIGGFAPDGPEQCSGLPVTRYSAAELVTGLGDSWTLTAEEREEHVTPAGVVQPFSWVACTRA
jgi:trans-aconitate methyltransferase